MLIPPEHQEIETLYHHLLNGKHRSAAISGIQPQSGASSVAVALTQRLLLAGKSALLVEFNTKRPMLESVTNWDNFGSESTPFPKPALMCPKNEQVIVNGVIARADRESTSKLKQPDVIAAHLRAWLNDYDYIIVDSGPLLEKPMDQVPTQDVLDACDCFVALILAGSATELMVEQALQGAQASRAQLLGCVINDALNPPLKHELIRELERLPRGMNCFKHWASQAIQNAKFLALQL